MIAVGSDDSSTTSGAKVITITCTVWKFENFSSTQILREINFGDSRSVKMRQDYFAQSNAK